MAIARFGVIPWLVAGLLLSHDSRTEAAESHPPTPAHCAGRLSQRLYTSALAAPGAALDDGTLYGMQRWRSGTGYTFLGVDFPGLLSCAYTVSAIFREACHPIGELPSVSRVASILANWRKITQPREIEPGDVVFWKPKPGKILGFSCPSHWHVGISLGGDATVDNDWWSGMPKVSSLSRTCKQFAYALRPPN